MLIIPAIAHAAAAKAAHEAGVGAEIKVRLGGSVDRRFTPMEITATVETLTRGVGRYETWPGVYNAGLTAVLAFDNFTLVVISRPVALVDRSLYYASGIDPEKFDLIVIKSPHCEYRMFDAWVEKNFNVDAPGATSANLKSLGHSICQRPVYPLDENVSFEPKPVRYVSRLHAQS
ncbi:MAG: MlrC C-terminal domain-containing protein [Pseudomonadota bacterium]|nr:MlrC C-terminal domain-containing protein [Pseudomonadota bacterium]